MKDDMLQEHQIKKDVSNKVFGYQLASIFLIIIFVRFIFFTKLNFIDLILFFISLILFTISKFKEVSGIENEEKEMKFVLKDLVERYKTYIR